MSAVVEIDEGETTATVTITSEDLTPVVPSIRFLQNGDLHGKVCNGSSGN